MSDGGRHWTDQELDDALDRLHGDVGTSDAGVTNAKARLLAEMRQSGDASRNSRWTRWATPRLAGTAASVLVVIGLVAALLVAQSATPVGPASAEAVATLEKAADAARIEATDLSVGPGQFQYVARRSWNLREIGSTDNGPAAYLAEILIETWAPAEYQQEWEMRRTDTGRKIWVLGSEADARAAGLMINYPSPDGFPDGSVRARCGDFVAVLTDEQPCTTPGQWQAPTREFIAGLPRNPNLLFDRLNQDAPDHGRGDSQMLIYAADALRGGSLPADLRTALFRALTMLRGLQVTDDAANLAGRRGVALGIDDERVRQEIIVDPITGAFVGERKVLTEKSETGVPAGTVIGFSAAESAVVGALGARPN